MDSASWCGSLFTVSHPAWTLVHAPPLPAPTHLTSESAGLAYSSCEGGRGCLPSFDVLLLICMFSSTGVVFYLF